MANNLSVDVIYRLSNIFEKNDWNITDNPPNLAKEWFDCFCKMFKVLSQDEIDLILKLTEDFKIYDLSIWDYLMDDVLNMMIEEIKMENLYKNDAIIVSPILPNGRFESIFAHSGHMMVYPLEIKLKEKLDKDKINIIGIIQFSDVQDTIKRKGYSHIQMIFVDDFIGSGTSALKTINRFKRETGDLFSCSYIIMSLVGMNNALQYLSTSYPIFCKKIHYRGIGDSKRFAELLVTYKIMLNIETNLSIEKKYSLGFKKTEALIKMLNTPNNTFPVFWCSKAKNGGKWYAPFVRF
jgi:hypothetical protein